MKDLFFYKREVTVKEKNPEYNPEAQDPKVPEFIDKLQVVEDCFNLNCVIRGHWKNLETFTVMLNDGHEQADDVQKPTFKNGKFNGMEIKRERAWYMSQIDLSREDFERLRVATELRLPAMAVPK